MNTAHDRDRHRAGPLVSIVIRNYNYSQFLHEAIESALDQRYSPSEVIVVDDGSTDNSREVIRTYGPRILAVYKDNGGLASGFNVGYSVSKGEVIIFLDSDDLLYPDAAEKVVSSWQPGVANIRYPLDCMTSDGSRTGTMVGVSQIMTTPEVRRALLAGPLISAPPTSGNAFARCALREIMPMPEGEWRHHADGYFAYLTPFLGEVVTLTAPLGAYRIHDSSVSAGRPYLVAARHQLAMGPIVYNMLLPYAGDAMPRCDEWLARSHTYCISRIVSLRLSPHDHPYRDTRNQLLGRALGAIARAGYSARKRAALSVWAVSLTVTPRVVLPRLLKFGRRAALSRRYSTVRWLIG